jgi:hypothetical protein
MSQVPFTMTLTYLMKCSLCEQTDTKSMTHFGGYEFWIPPTPGGWRIIDGELVCPDHTVRVTKKRNRSRAAT